MAFSTLEPFGNDADNIGHAITASTIANVNRGKNQKAYKVEDFMPRYKNKKSQTENEMLQIAAMATAANSGVDLREAE